LRKSEGVTPEGLRKSEGVTPEGLDVRRRNRVRRSKKGRGGGQRAEEGRRRGIEGEKREEV
jgi:hypothetical protein